MEPASNTRSLRLMVAAALSVVVFVIGTLKLESTPPLWQDEGWTLCAARTWAETGVYAFNPMGELSSATRSASFIVVAPIALSFKLFGVGIYQARVVGVVITIAALLLMYALTKRLYGFPVALCTMFLLLILPVKWGLHTLFIGRQVLGENQSLFYLLAGFTCFMVAERSPKIFLPLAILAWGVAWTTKFQVAPFLIGSFLIPLALVALRREWKMVRILTMSLAGAFLVSRGLVLVKDFFLGGRELPTEMTTGLLKAAATVFVPSVRLSTLAFAISFGMPTLIGLAYVVWRKVPSWKANSQLSFPAIAELMVITFAGGWFTWYVLLSIGWERYAYPPVFLATPFVALFIRDTTRSFNAGETIKHIRSLAVRVRNNRAGLLALNATLLIVFMIFLASVALYKFHKSAKDTSILDVAEYINTSTAENAVVETLDSELFFLLKRKYHYPPPQVDVMMVRRTWLGDQTPFAYNPTACNPDYLVVGNDGEWSGVYKDVIDQGKFRLDRLMGRYKIYRRASP